VPSERKKKKKKWAGKHVADEGRLHVTCYSEGAERSFT
jgi:hypothetical protein